MSQTTLATEKTEAAEHAPEAKAPIDPRVVAECKRLKLPVSEEFVVIVEYADKNSGVTKKRVDTDFNAMLAAWLDGRQDLQAAVHAHLTRTGRQVLGEGDQRAFYGVTKIRGSGEFPRGKYIWPEKKLGVPGIWRSEIPPPETPEDEEKPEKDEDGDA